MMPTRSALPQMGTWQLPVLGRIADEAVPEWIVKRMLSSDLVINSLGGFTSQDLSYPHSCVAGDLVVLLADDRIEFRRPEDEPAPMLAAA
jgi:hypothetical protein